MGVAFFFKQYIKSAVQNLWLPRLYKKAAKCPVNPKKVIFADAHSYCITPSMESLYEYFKNRDFEVVNYCADFSGMAKKELINYLKNFMKEYAEARFVFISSYFLPVSSCKKRPETTVVQLWHSGGLMKKMGYDTTEDIPKYYKGHVAANYDLVTVSAEVCVPVWAKALKIDEKTVKPLGLIRTDKYYDKKWNDENREKFYGLYPQAKGKKVAIYAPTFQGNAQNPYITGLKQLITVRERLADEWFIVIKLHPHLENRYPEFHCELRTEELFSSADLLITDYSSVLYDWIIYKKPFLLFAPDLSEYEEKRGLYIDYRSLPAPVAESQTGLYDMIKSSSWEKYADSFEECFKYYMGACDGNAMKRLLKELKLDTSED